MMSMVKCDILYNLIYQIYAGQMLLLRLGIE